MASDYRPKIVLDPNGLPFSEQAMFWNARFSKEGGTNVVYTAYSKPGLAESVPGWFISKNTYDASGDVSSKKFAGGRADFFHVYDNGDTVTITGATQANPVVVTVDADNYDGGDGDAIADGDVIEITGVAGMTELNGKFFIVANHDAGANTFELTDLDGVNVNGTGYTAYSSGGEAHKRTYANLTYS